MPTEKELASRVGQRLTNLLEDRMRDRTNMERERQSRFVAVAKAKGMSNTHILLRHVLRPSTVTLLTVAGLNIAQLVNGAIVVEFIYDFVVTMCDAASSDELASVNGVDPDQHVDESRFNEIEAAEMSSRIRSAGERARAALDRLDSVALDRILEFNGNPAPLRLLTVAMLHESHHHLRDVARLATE